MTGAMYIAECLKQEGVTKVFGQCGHTNYALIDACHRLGIEYVSFRHEQMAAHAADAYFRVSHKLAVLNVHLSPGLTNAITGVVTAAADSTPMLVFAGNTQSYHHAREPHQGIRFHADASQGDIYRPFCKRVWRVDDVNLLADVMPLAQHRADRPSRRRARRCADRRVLCADFRGRHDRVPSPRIRPVRRPARRHRRNRAGTVDSLEAGYLRRKRCAVVRGYG
jgi:thiamine pyrophosphate-dependent acetolactate synthase large subunit-like protein